MGFRIKTACCLAALFLGSAAMSESLSDFIKTHVAEEKEARGPQKPISEMSDEEVICHSVLQAQDKMYSIGAGAASALEEASRSAVKRVAGYIRKREAGKDSPVRARSQEPSAGPPEAECPSANAPIPKSDAPSVQTGRSDEENGTGALIITVSMLTLFVSAVVYTVACARVKSGAMVVYASWGDFAASAAWIFLGVLGYGCEYAAAEGEPGLARLAFVLKTAACASAIWMLGGAFQNKGILNVLLAMPARIIVGSLAVLAGAKLKEAMDGLKDGRRGIVDGVLIPLGIALFVFNALVKPIVGDRRN